MPNRIHNLDTKTFRNDSGEFPAIVMGLDITDADTADAFLDDVVQQFKNQRMCSPPSTANMTITLAGSMTAERFRDMWAQRAATDQILKAFMSMMFSRMFFTLTGVAYSTAPLCCQSPNEHDAEQGRCSVRPLRRAFERRGNS